MQSPLLKSGTVAVLEKKRGSGGSFPGKNANSKKPVYIWQTLLLATHTEGTSDVQMDHQDLFGLTYLASLRQQLTKSCPSCCTYLALTGPAWQLPASFPALSKTLTCEQ